MAALVRVTKVGCRLATFWHRSSPLLRTHFPAIPTRVYSSTSKKVNQSEFVTGKQTEIEEERVQEIIREGERKPSLTDPNDPSYVSHGFSTDPHVDLWSYRLIFLVCISFMLVFGPLYIHYLPDSNNRVWARREANRVIAERREKARPLIKADLCDPEKMILPSEEEEERVWKAFRGQRD